MASRVRRILPDNLDPLVDTLANVVGILVIVIVLTQIELGDALDRLASVEARRAQAARARAEEAPRAEATLAARRDALRARTELGPESSIELAQRVLDDLSALPRVDAQSALDATTRKGEIKRARAELARTRAAAEERARYAGALARVSAERVARLPEPQVVRGLESWVLVRYGRVYLVDRERLYDEGSEAIRRILPDGTDRRVRLDEFETVAHYLRKQPVGTGNFRWQLRTEPSIQVELEWASKDGGIDRTQLSASPVWRSWLSGLDPERDFLRFHVWSDSFETYLAARQATEGAGFRAGWQGYDEGEEMTLNLRFGPVLPRERSIEVD